MRSAFRSQRGRGTHVPSNYTTLIYTLLSLSALEAIDERLRTEERELPLLIHSVVRIGRGAVPTSGTAPIPYRNFRGGDSGDLSDEQSDDGELKSEAGRLPGSVFAKHVVQMMTEDLRGYFFDQKRPPEPILRWVWNLSLGGRRVS